MTFLARIFDWQKIKSRTLRIYHAYRRLAAVYLIVIGCAGAVTIMEPQVPIYPLSFYSLGWFLALFFPVISITFILCSINVRYNEIIRRFERDSLWFVYFPSDDPKEAKYEFSKFLWERVNDYYALLEFAIFSLLAGALTFLAYYLVTEQFYINKPILELAPELGATWAVLVGAGFLGSLSGSLVFILRRYRMCDLRPMVFLQTIVALVAGTTSGAFITVVYPQNSLGVLSFIIGFLSAINIEFLPNLMRAHFAKLTGTELPDKVHSDLSDVVKNTEAIESLNALSIYSIRELANADPVRLYLNMPQQIEMINTMVDQAMLHFYFSKMTSELEQVNIHRFTQLLFALRPTFSDKDIWPQHVDIMDNNGPKDRMLLNTMRGIIDGGLHHRVLGIFIEPYRQSFFLQNKKKDVDRP